MEQMMVEASAAVEVRRFAALGTVAELAVPTGCDIELAVSTAMEEVREIDLACSRFRPDSEILRLVRAEGRPVIVSDLLFTAVATALDVAERTQGAVDPTVGQAISAWGYDRHFRQLASESAQDGARYDPGSPVHLSSPCTGRPGEHPDVDVAVPGWKSVELDPVARTIAVPAGTVIDLGASGKALAADRAASRIATLLGCPTLVSLGGDLSIAGPQLPGGWPVGIAAVSSAGTAEADHQDGAGCAGPGRPDIERSEVKRSEVEQVVSLSGGGLATSSPHVRSWSAAGAFAHHIIDPRIGRPAALTWRLVSAAGPTCVHANAAATAAIVWGAEAPQLLAQLGCPARLVSADSEVVTVGGWPT